MLDALVAGTTDPAVLADLARGKLRKKLPALRQALVGRFRGHHAFLVAQILAHLDYLDEAIETVSTQIDTVIAPFADQLARLDIIPGVNQRTAEVLIAELGVDMRVFPTAGHLASGAGLCPGNNGSAGKHRSGRTRKGNRWLRGALIEATLSAGTHSTTGALAARYRRVMQHRGHKKAVVGRRPRHPHHRLPPVGAADDVSRPGGRLLRSSPCRARAPPRDSYAGTPRLPRHARTRRLSARSSARRIF